MSKQAMWTVAFKMNAVITVVKESAKQNGSDAAVRYKLYTKGITVEQYVAACEKKGFKAYTARSDVIWDSDRGFITVAGYKPLGESLPKGKRPAAPAKKAEKTKGRTVAGATVPSASVKTGDLRQVFAAAGFQPAA